MTRRIDPRIRALGKARIDAARRATSEHEFQRMWHAPRYPLPFHFSGWKYALQYYVDDYAAEIGYYIDVLGFPVEAFSSSLARFTTPHGDFFFSVAAASDGFPATDPRSFSLQLMVDNLVELLKELDGRGVAVERVSAPQVAVPMLHACLYTPHGVCIELWSLVHVDQLDISENPQTVEPATAQGEYAHIETSRDHVDDFFQAEADEAADLDDVVEVGEAGENSGDQPNLQTLEITYEDIEEEGEGSALMAQPAPQSPPASQAPFQSGVGRSQPSISRSQSPLKSNRMEVSGPAALVPSARSNGKSHYPSSGSDSSNDHLQ